MSTRTAAPAAGPRGSRRGTRALRRPRRRARGLSGALGLTALSGLLPGVGYLYTGRKVLGLIVLLPVLAGLGAGAWYVGRDLDAAIAFATDPTRLQVAAAALGAGLLVWLVIVLTTYAVVRPETLSRWKRFVGGFLVLVLCTVGAAPVAVAARYALVQADLVHTLFERNQTVTAPKGTTKEDPWAGRRRVNVLLLGGDGSVHRPGVRTDSMILMSIDTHTGRSVMFSLPRNMMNAQFPGDSPLYDLYPDGFGGTTDASNWMLNAIYRQVPALHPGILGKSDNEGADALKQAVQGSLQVPVDYYVLVNLLGFRQIVDAMGGVTVNINQPIPIGGNTDLGILPDDYLQPGPHQRLDGFHALWYSRGRYGSDDYHRMERQRCMIDAIVDEADPLNLLRRYQDLAAAGKKIVRTDIPSELLPAFVDLATRMKGGSVKSVVFRSSEAFYPGDPDFDWMRDVVRRGLLPPRSKGNGGGTPAPLPSASPSGSPSAEPDPGAAVDAHSTCAYNPVS